MYFEDLAIAVGVSPAAAIGVSPTAAGVSPTIGVSPTAVLVLGVFVESRPLYPEWPEAGPYHDSGVDLRFPADLAIPPQADCGGLPTIVDLQVRAACFGVDGRPRPFAIVPRSSICKTPLSLANGVGIIDAGYRGTLKVAVRNHGSAPFCVARGSSLFQAVGPGLTPMRVAIVGEGSISAASTARGAGGFGSTGVAGTRAAA